MTDTGRAILIALVVLIAVALLWGTMMMAAGGIGPSMMGGMGWGRSAGTTASSPPVTGAKEITVQAGDLWFKPTTLEIPAGTPVNVTVTNTGGLFHDVTIDTLDFRLGVNPGRAATGGLRVDVPDEYRFYCSVPGHAAAGMRGTLVVTKSS